MSTRPICLGSSSTFSSTTAPLGERLFPRWLRWSVGRLASAGALMRKLMFALRAINNLMVDLAFKMALRKSTHLPNNPLNLLASNCFCGFFSKEASSLLSMGV